MTRLSVNVNKVALLRNSRPLDIPSVVHVARLALDAGAHGITVHPRPDARHIRRDDVGDLLQLTRGRGVEFNIEGNPFHQLMDVVRASVAWTAAWKAGGGSRNAARLLIRSARERTDALGDFARQLGKRARTKTRDG